MKNKTLIIVSITILSILALSFIGGMIYFLKNDFNFNFSFGSKNMSLIDSFEMNALEIKNIKLNVYSTDIEIEESKTEDIKVEYFSSKEKDIEIRKENNSIIIDEDKINNVCVGICFNKRKIVLYIPNSYTGEYNIETISGDIKSSIDMTNNKFNFITKSGDLSLQNVGLINITTISGDLEIKNINDDASIQTTSGDMEINQVNKTININTTSGDIDINELNISDNSNIKTISGDIEINNNISHCYVEIDTVSGDKKINNSDRKSDIVLKVKTVSGDISVN